MGAAIVMGLEAEAASALLAGPALVTANITNDVLNLLGIETLQQGTVISQPHVFAYEIHHRCLGILPASALIIVMCIQPYALSAKLTGIIVGLPLLFVLNITRLVHLFLVGIYQPAYFWLAHHVIWNLIIFVFVVLLIIIWLNWLERAAIRISSLNYQKGMLSNKEECGNWKEA